MPILDVLEESGDEIFENADSVVIEVDMDKEIVKKVVSLCESLKNRFTGLSAI